MYNRPSSYNRYQQEPTAEQLNMKEKQYYLQSSSINPLTGQAMRADQNNNQSPYINNNLQQKVALQSSSINPLTGAPVMRNPLAYNPNDYSKTSGNPYGENRQQYSNDPRFQKNLEKFFATDDPNPIKQKVNSNDPRFQKNLEKFFATDDPNPIKQKVNSNDPKFQKNLEKFFAADDQSQPKVKRNRTPLNQVMQANTQQQQYSRPYGQQQQQSYGQQYGQQQNHYGQQQQQSTSDAQLQKLQNDPYYQKNLTKFFGADDNSVPKKLANNIPYQQQQQMNNLEKQKQQRLEQDPRFQKNLQQFFGADENSQKTQGMQGTIQQSNLNKQQKVVAIVDSSSSARNQMTNFFRTRGVEDFDLFTAPGGAFSIINNQIWEQSLKQYLDTIQKAYNIKEMYLIQDLDQNSNAKLYTNANDKKSHMIAMENLKGILVGRLNIQVRINGIIIDQRGASEKVF